MKKIVIILIVYLIVFSGVQVKNNFSLLNYFSGDYTVYTSSNNGIDLGFCYMTNEKVDNDIIGESIVVENLEIGDALKNLKAKVVKTEYIENGTTIIYAHTYLINNTVKVDNQNVNLQIAERNNTTIIGWPLIIGSF